MARKDRNFSEQKNSLVYRSGDAFLPQEITNKLSTYIVGDDHTLFYLNYWSIIHFSVGLTLGLVIKNISYGQALIIHLLWESWQLAIGMTKPNSRGFLDAGVDTLLFMLGFWLSKKIQT